jgi:2-methylcitrate dehydratase PrpD
MTAVTRSATGLTRRLVTFATACRSGSLPPESTERAKALLLDTLAAAYGARSFVPSCAVLAEGLVPLGLRHGDASVLGDPGDWSPLAAALVNGALAHGMDMDDTFLPSPVHPSAVLVPTALAAAELVGANGETTLRALIAGYEGLCRVARAMAGTGHIERGFHQTATVGVFGATITAGLILGLDETQLESALGLAGSQAAGSTQFAANGAWNKTFHVGAAAMNGLLAATLGKANFLGASDALEGPRGFLNAYGDGAHADCLVAELGERWDILRIGVKPYPCCRCSHAALDGLLKLRAEHAIRASEVVEVSLGVSSYALGIVAGELPSKWRPATTVEAQFSLPFGAAVALIDGRMGWEQYDLVGSGPVQTLIEATTVSVDPEAERNHPDNWSARVTIATMRGPFETFVKTPLGEPETFPDMAAMRAKFTSYATPALGDHAVAIAHRLERLEAEADIRNLTRALRGSRAERISP